MSANRHTMKNEWNRVVRSAKRTLRRCVGLGPQKITNANVGTEATQCGKFARFDELYEEYKNIPSLQIQSLMDILRSSVDFMNELPDMSNDVCLVPGLADDVQRRLQMARDIVVDLPTTPRYFNVLKTEMGFFITFLHDLYGMKALMCPTPTISFASTPRNSFSIPMPNWSRVSLSSTAPEPLPLFNNVGKNNMHYYMSSVLRRNPRRRTQRKGTRTYRR